MHKNIDEVEFSIFDTETTGLKPHLGDRIVEIAAVRLKGKKRLATFRSLVDPGRGISESAFLVNRITSQMLSGAPSTEEVIPRFLDFIKGSYLCSYNAGFDLEFLNQELRLMGWQPLKNILVVDILKMARRLMPGLERYALWFVAERLGIKNEQKHRALADVMLTVEVFERLKEILQTKGIIDFNNFFHLFGLNADFLNDINYQKISQIQEALNLGVRLKIRYLSHSSAQVTEREVLPEEIRHEGDHSYLLGHCYLRNEKRSFRIDSILDMEMV
ncbi:MAG: exonuclease domain-containing protein [Candidatus Omnitrophica bacterium]|nr:exonuclease domain-containing protein [Candidatus Omnitrophota bacterium]